MRAATLIISSLIFAVGETMAMVQAPTEPRATDRAQLEQTYLDDMMRHQPRPAANSTQDLSSRLIAMPADSLFIAKGKTHLLDKINQDTYYDKQADGYRLVYDTSRPAETLANLINAYHLCDHSTLINIKFNLYGNKKHTILLPLRQFLDFSATLGETAFVGIEIEGDECVEASIFLDNNQGKYTHVVFVRADINTLTDSSIPLQAEAYLYCPTQ